MSFKNIIIPTTFVALLLTSCDGMLPQRIIEEDEQYEEDDSSKIGFQVITYEDWMTSKERLDGLLLLSDDRYVLFDDEEDYYDIAPIAIMAYNIAEELYKCGYSEEVIEHWLPQVINLPIDNEIGDADIKEIFNSVYYDNRDKEIYTTEEKYGYREFPYGEIHTHKGSWVMEVSGWGRIPSGRNSIIIERASKTNILGRCNEIPTSAIFITNGWFY